MELKSRGITRGYPWLSRRFGRLPSYIALLRPFTLVAPLVAGVIGVMTPLKQISLSNIETAIYIGITLALCQGAGQCLNQYADAELDKQIKPYRPIPSGRVSREEALGLSWLLAMFTVGRAFTIGVNFGLTILVLLGFAVFYSVPPFSPRKINPLLNTAWMAISRGFIPMYAVWSIYGDTSIGLRYSLLALLWVMGFQASKDVPDIEGDRRFGIKTIPGIYGMKGLLFTMGVCTAVYTIIAAYFGLYPMLLVLPLAAVAMLTTNKKSGLTENNISWTCFYLGLACLYILMFLSFHLHLTPYF
jgi:geranylgeranylglycerol-phosphate geranylgeranyltransferase